MHSLLPALAFALLSGFAAAAAGQPVSFAYKDWDLVCDNTRTCRAAGYQREQDEAAVSVLLTRPAGARQAVTAQVTLATDDAQAPVPAQVTLTVAGRPLGTIAIGKDDAAGTLNAAQVAGLLEALQRNGAIVFTANRQSWRLSDAGAAAVLLRMDEAQGRVGTTGAIVGKGATGEEGVRPPQPKPLVRAAALPAGPAPAPALAVAVLRSLKRPPPECPDLQEPSEPPQIWRLAPGKVLVSQRCWVAAYNVGYGFWIAGEQPPYRPAVVSYDATEFDPETSRLLSMQKGRGLGDCYDMKQWVWDGARFVPTGEFTTGRCRLVAAGGPWNLPTLVSEVVAPAGKKTTEGKRK